MKEKPILFHLTVNWYFFLQAKENNLVTLSSVVSSPYFEGCLFHFKVIQGAKESQAGYEPADNSKDPLQGSKKAKQ